MAIRWGEVDRVRATYLRRDELTEAKRRARGKRRGDRRHDDGEDLAQQRALDRVRDDVEVGVGSVNHTFEAGSLYGNFVERELAGDSDRSLGIGVD